MKKSSRAERKNNQKHLKYWLILLGVLIAIATGLYLLISLDSRLSSETPQRLFYALGSGLLLAGLVAYFLHQYLFRSSAEPKRERPVWFFPLIAGLLALCIASLAYGYLGISPIGTKSATIIDMYHQYAPLLAQLRERILNSGSPFYAFDIGLGTSFLPLFAYYLASPLNLILLIFSPDHLSDAVFLITLIKITLCAVSFASCLQYLYRRRNLSVVIASLMYALSMYIIAYSWNIMWLDIVMITPIVIMSFERLMRTGKFSAYVLSLAYALYVNYYLAFMLCIFLVLYYIFYSLRRKRGGLKIQTANLLRFGLGSLVAAGLSMFLILPVYLSLGQTSAAGGSLPAFGTNFDLFDLLGRHLYGGTPVMELDKLPNIFTSILTILLVPLFLTIKTIPLRRRLAYLGLLLIMAASFTINQWDLVWHGLHVPNGLPYRFSFLYVFVILLIVFETLCHLKDLTMRQIALSVAGAAGVIVLIERLDDGDAIKPYAIYISLALVLVYGGVLALIRAKLTPRVAYTLLLPLVVGELLFSASRGLADVDADWYYPDYKDFVDNGTVHAMRAAVAKLKQKGDKEADGSFYRLETLPRRTTMDPALLNYRGLSTFASSNSLATTKFLGSLGYDINGVNSYLYRSIVPPVDSLLGIRYVALKASDYFPSSGWKSRGSASAGTDSFNLYENPDALPIGYYVYPETKDLKSVFKNPFKNQNLLIKTMTGLYDDDLYYEQHAETDPFSYGRADINEDGDILLYPSKREQLSFNIDLDRDGQAFVYIKCRDAVDIKISTNFKTGNKPYRPSVSGSGIYIVNVGEGKAGETITIGITTEKNLASGSIYAAILNEDAYAQAMEQLSAGGLHITDFNDTRLNGTIDSPSDGLVFTSIPYDSGWSVTVDGHSVETYDVGKVDGVVDGEESKTGGLLAFAITAGAHDVTLSFTPQGLITGVIIAASSLVVLVVLIWLFEYGAHKGKPSVWERSRQAALSRKG